MPNDNSIFLPFDLVEKIFSHIPSTDHATLSACSQTSKSFGESMQRRLFEDINLEYALTHERDGMNTLEDIEGDNKSRLLLSSLIANPALASYIHSFSFTGTESIPARWNIPEAQECPPPSILKILPLLTSLDTFSFYSGTNATPGRPQTSVHYEFLCSSLQTAIQDLFMRSDSIKSVTLTGVRGFPLNQLRRLTNIETVRISSVSLIQYISHYHCLSPPPYIIHPKSLHIEEMSKLYRESSSLDKLIHILHPQNGKRPTFSFARLESLSLMNSAANQKQTRMLIDAIPSETLTELAVTGPQNAIKRFHNRPYTDIPNFSLLRFRMLESLKLRGKVNNVYSASQDKFVIQSHCRWIGSVLTTLPQIMAHDTNDSGPHPPPLSLVIELEMTGPLSPTDIANLPFGQFTNVLNASIEGGALINTRLELHFYNFLVTYPSDIPNHSHINLKRLELIPTEVMPQGKPIPYDIYVEIFSYISNDDKDTLSACSQLAPCFREAMQKRLFKSINLDYEERHVDDIRGYEGRVMVWADEIEESRSKMLLRALKSNPELAEYIKELTITISHQGGYNMWPMLGDKTITANDFLSRVSSLTALSVMSNSRVVYAMYSETLQFAIRQLLARNTNLSSVNLSGIFELAIAEVQYLPSPLKSLTLGYISNIRPLLPGEDEDYPGDQDGPACAPTSLCIANRGAIDTFFDALRGEVNLQVKDEYSDSYYVHTYMRRTPYLILSKLESLEIYKSSFMNDVRDLLSFADCSKIQHIYIKTPFLSHSTHSIIFDDHEAPSYELKDAGATIGPLSLNGARLDLSDFSGLKSFETHGKMTFVQDASLLSTTISTHIPWLIQAIENLPRPNNVGLSAADNTHGPSLRSVRVVLHVVLKVINDNNKSGEVFALFNFSPLVSAMKKIQHQYTHLRDVACSLDFKVTVLQEDVPEHPHYNVEKEEFLETLQSNPTLQDDSDDNKVMLRVLDVRRLPYSSA
ncbi:hypothetical protein CVT24_001816 [Panaeolus cyanescens]|uniref:F-box domain-containing protein n=1 Tax=Panaeolus cyanescens TaxID=181874 RepID=A0A409YFG3_9AGAR|nr:hypothetical protein CVT24_001816 [Panaeolus cyanescens]